MVLLLFMYPPFHVLQIQKKIGGNPPLNPIEKHGHIQTSEALKGRGGLYWHAGFVLFSFALF
jgi:hypothetical protein